MVQGNWLLRQWSLHSARRRTAPVLKKDVYARSNLQSKEPAQLHYLHTGSREEN